MEILAPAGDWNCLEAAVKAGADAVYFGLENFNARRRARNFSLEEAAQAVRLLHAEGRRAYLTLNTDLSYRELGLAYNLLAQAASMGMDAVLVRDPALLAVRKAYPSLEFHMSTQTCLANSADVLAAAALGANRVVLARELSLSEISAICSQSPIGVEVFGQGALCFSVSGRCLMSSWVGGRSGNRGLCASPCRVPWRIDGKPAGTPLSMHDLCVLDHVQRLREMGVASLKIEGRLKSAEWVAQAVAIYRRALAGDPIDILRREAERLTDYTGRELTDNYLTGMRCNLTGANRGRVATETTDRPGSSSEENETTGDPSGIPDRFPRQERWTFDFSLTTAAGRIECRLVWGEREARWDYPKTVVRRIHKAVAASELCERIRARRFQGLVAETVQTDAPDFLLVPRTANAIVDQINAELSRFRRQENQPVSIVLPAGADICAAELVPGTANVRMLGDKPNRVRISLTDLEDFVARVQPVQLIVDGASADDVPFISQICRKHIPVIALPPVCFEDDLPKLQELIAKCQKARLAVEVNTWGQWFLVRRAGMAFETGPGLAVLNPVAAAFLRKLGARTVTISLEADRRQIEDICGSSPVGLSLYVMGRPPLAITRAELPEEFLGRLFSDRRDLKMTPRREWGLWVFRPEVPFDWRRIRNEKIRVKHLVVDLVGSPDPVGEWLEFVGGSRPFTFNYYRSLQ